MRSEKRIYALGFFDGVHLGHQALLSACRDLAEKEGCTPAAITFAAHPKSLFSASVPALLTTCQDRQALMHRYGISHIHCFPTTKEVMSTSWQDFLEQLLEEGAAGFVCGHDFRFGHRGEGNSEKLRAFCAGKCLPCVIIPEQTFGGKRVSSTLIRGLIEDGEMESATKFLGHPHVLTGTVRPGQQLGRKLGFPTANLHLPEGLAVPKFGVYACGCIVDGVRFPAVTNIGTRPTVEGDHITVEPWIMDYSGDLYGRDITLEFFRFLRPEQKFPDLQALQAQIRADARQTREYLNQR